MRSTWLSACLAMLATARPAQAQDFIFSAEPAVAFWLDEPQARRFDPGFYLALRPGFTMGSVLSFQLSYALLKMPPGDGYDAEGGAQALMGGLRVRPFAPLRPVPERLGGLFIDGNIGYVRTGRLDRLGFDAALGYGFQVTHRFSVGPVLRYSQIVQPDDLERMNPNDAQLLSVGLNLSFRPAHEARPVQATVVDPAVVAPAPVRTEKPEEPTSTGPCPDYDRDGVCDADDRCRTKIGPPATMGCPIDPCSGDPLLVLVQFPFDSAAMPAPVEGDLQTMDPVLDAVVDAIAQDPSCRVCIMGNASEEGPADYNQTLSVQRATAVQRYMVARGLSNARIPTIGLGARCQLVPETSRLLNRRVDFRRLQEGESCSPVCAE